LRRFSLWVLKWFGWKLVGSGPQLKKYILIFAPHTSNWDVALLFFVRFALGIKPRFIGKHTLFWPPLSWLFRSLGGEPVNRSKATNVVSEVARLFNERDEFIFALSPEGTRSKKPYWKSGFYRIAEAADVPIVLAFMDTRTKEVGIGPILYPSGDIEKDFQWIKAFYQDKKGFRPELLSDIRVNVEKSKKE